MRSSCVRIDRRIGTDELDSSRASLRFRLLVLALAAGAPGRRRRAAAQGARRRPARVHAALRRGPDRGARPVGRRGRAAHHRPARGRTCSTASRASTRSARDSVPGPLVDHPALRAGHRHLPRAPARRRSASRRRTRCPNVSKPPQMLQPLSSTSRVMMIGLSSRQALADRALGARPLDDPAAAPGRRRRRQRRDLGPARPPAAGPGRPRSACARSASRSTQVIGTAGNAQLGLAADVPRGLDAGHRRLHRHARTSACSVRHILPIVTPERPGQRPGRGQRRERAAPRRRRDGRRGPPAADRRRRRRRRRPGLLARRREVARRRTRSRSRAASRTRSTSCGPGLAGVTIDLERLPPRRLHRDGDSTTSALAAHRRRRAARRSSLVASCMRWRAVAGRLVAVPLSLVAALLVLDADRARRSTRSSSPGWRVALGAVDRRRRRRRAATSARRAARERRGRRAERRRCVVLDAAAADAQRRWATRR